MAEPDFKFQDGFDKYMLAGAGNGIGGGTAVHDPAEALLTSGEWTSTNYAQSLGFGAGIGSYGGATLQGRTNQIVYITKTLPARMMRSIGGVHLVYDTAYTSDMPLITLQCNGPSITLDAQATIGFNQNTGSLYYAHGAYNGTKIVDLPGVLSAGTSACVEWDICCKLSGGWVKVWLNGQQVINQTGINSAEEGVDGIDHINLGCGYYTDVDHFYSRFWLSDVDNGETPALNNPIIYTDYPVADVARDSVGGKDLLGYFDVNSGSLHLPNNNLYMHKITPLTNCSLVSLGFRFRTLNTTFKSKMALYSHVNGAPGDLLAQSAEIVGNNGTTPQEYPLAYSLVAGTNYWIVYHADTYISSGAYDAQAGAQVTSFSQTYANGFPASLQGVAAGISSAFPIYAVIDSATEAWPIVNEKMPINPTREYIELDTALEEDTFSFAPLPFNTAQVIDVAIKAGMTAEGAATVDLVVDSAANRSAGNNTDIAPATGTTTAFVSSHFPLNPNGNVPWTKATLDAMAAGYQVKTIL